MGTQQVKKKRTEDTRAFDSEIKRIQDLDANKLALIGGYEAGYEFHGINTISYANVSSSLVGGTQTVDAGLPGPPQDIMPEAVSTTAINVFYKQAMANPIPTQYKSYRSFTYEFTSPIIAIITYAAGNGTFSYSGLTPNTRYYFKYSSINANGEGQTSGIISAVTLSTGGIPIIDTTPPAQVVGLIAVAASAFQINLTWDPNTEPDVDHYNIYRGTTSGFTVTLGVTPPIATSTLTSYSNMGLSAATTYYYKISAVDDAGNLGPVSLQASATTNPLPKTADFLLHLDNSLVDNSGNNIAFTSLQNSSGFSASGSTPFGTHHWNVNYPNDLGQGSNIAGDFLDFNPAVTPIRMDTTTGFSVSLWAYCADTAALTSRRVIIEGREDANNMWSIQFDSAGIIYFFVKKGGTDYKRQVGTLPLFGWHHIAAVFDGVANTVKIYFDGTEGASSAATTQLPTATGPLLSIAHRITNTQTRFRGFLDEIQYFKAYRLSAGEVTNLMNNNTVG